MSTKLSPHSFGRGCYLLMSSFFVKTPWLIFKVTPNRQPTHWFHHLLLEVLTVRDIKLSRATVFFFNVFSKTQWVRFKLDTLPTACLYVIISYTIFYFCLYSYSTVIFYLFISLLWQNQKRLLSIPSIIIKSSLIIMSSNSLEAVKWIVSKNKDDQNHWRTSFLRYV